MEWEGKWRSDLFFLLYFDLLLIIKDFSALLLFYEQKTQQTANDFVDLVRRDDLWEEILTKPEEGGLIVWKHRELTACFKARRTLPNSPGFFSNLQLIAFI